MIKAKAKTEPRRGSRWPGLLYSKAIAAVIAVLLTVAFMPTVASAQEGWGWNDLMSVQYGLSLWTIVTFLIMLAVLARYAWKPLLAALDAREGGIQSVIDDAKRQRDEAEAVLAEHKQQLADGRRQAQEILAESREAADRLRKELEEKAREDVRTMLNGARRDIERERVAAVESVRREAVDIALAAASRLVSERMDSDADRRLVMAYVDNLESKGSGGQA